jgi:hypothetical protein
VLANTLRGRGRQLVQLLSADRKPDPWFALAGTALFAVALALVHTTHELWRDEMHCWILGRNSTGLVDLLTGTRRYDGHPFLWYYLLFLVSRLSRSTAALHATTVAIAAVSAYLWLRDGPLSRLARASLLTTYLFFYEYGVLSRSYALGILLLFSFCGLYRRQRLRVLLLSLVLVLLSLTSAYGALLAIALGLMLYGQRIADLIRAKAARRRPAIETGLGVALLAGGLCLSWATTTPAHDSQFLLPGALTGLRLWPHLPVKFWMASFPSWDPSNGAWPVRYGLGEDQPWLVPLLPWAAVAWFVLWLLAFRKVPAVALLYATGVLLMAVFQHTVYSGLIRHYGHYFLLLVICVWLYFKQSERKPRLLPALLGVALAAQTATGAAAVAGEIALPFSGSHEAAEFLRSHGMADLPLVGSYDHAVSAVAGYLDRPFRSAESDKRITSVVFDQNRWRKGAPPQLAFELAVRDAVEAGRPAIVILNLAFPPPVSRRASIDLVYTTERPVVANEQFWIYRVTATQP